MKLALRRYFAAGFGPLVLVLLCASATHGQAKIQLDEDRFVTVGGGVRATFRSNESGPSSGEYIQKVSLESARLYFNAQLHKQFQVEMNTEFGSPTSELRILDAVVKFAPSPYFNVWMGRHLPPSDRANLDGPYFLSAYDYPGLVSRYPGIFAGRDNGVSVSGQVREGKFKYAFGFYDGLPTVLSKKDNMLYATRFVVNLLDPEPGYYNSSTYYGDKNILALGFVAQHQADVVIKNGLPESFTGYNFDLLFEKKLPDNGAVTLEGAFYDYDYKNTAGDGSAYMLQAAYLFSRTAGIGKLQPIIRYQDFRHDTSLDAGINYVIRGHNARLSFMFSRLDLKSTGTTEKFNQFTAGTQFQF
jgi:hypothetical protein